MKRVEPTAELIFAISLVLIFMIEAMIQNDFAVAWGEKHRPAGLGQLQKTSTDSQFWDGVIVVKFTRQSNVLNKSSLGALGAINKRMNKHGVYAVEKAFSFLERSSLQKAENLRQIFYLNYSTGENPISVAKDFAVDPNVEFAEPVPVLKFADTPNDSLFAQQAYLNLVKATPAWDVVKGESGNVVIAIVDGGTDWRHEDLVNNIWVNEDETPGNGVDDDENGFVDDVRGWNFATDSNDPAGRASQTQSHNHGTHVAGIAVAATNNLRGVAGMSWNCQLMPINVAPTNAGNDSTLGRFSYDGIAYAAANGADIISCSWSGSFRSRLQQEVIDVALANGALVVAAASNDGSNNDESPQFPANYNHVLAVGSTRNDDRKSSFSNYGVTVDVFAPGEGIVSTLPNNRYAFLSGTSMSTPLVAGIAGLVKTLNPGWSVEQVREQVRVTAENIDGQNSSFAGLLGKGRVNALRALTVTDQPALRVVGTTLSDVDGDGRLAPGESADLTVRFLNYLADATGITVTLLTNDNNFSIMTGVEHIATINQGDTSTVAFRFDLLNEVADGYLGRFTADISGANYSDRDLFEVVINPAQFLNHDTGTLQTSITTQGNLGFTGFSNDSDGLGFVFDGANLLFEGGLMIGAGPLDVSDCIRGSGESVQDNDFKPTSALSFASPGAVADEEAAVVLEDAFASNPLGIEVVQQSFAYASEPFNDFVIYKYTIKNNGTADLTNLWAGLFFDWDITSSAEDFARFDQARNLGLVQNDNTDPTRLAATKVLTSPGATSYRSLDNANEIYGGNAGNGFTSQEKWSALSGGIQTTTLGGVDVSTLTSTGPFALAPEQTVEIAFAVIGGSSSDDLFANAGAAQFLWNNGLIPELDTSAPRIATSVLQNPAASKYADIVVVSDRTLQSAPNVTAGTGSNTASVTMSLIPGAISVYKGAFEFTESGTYTIRTNAVGAINGVDSTQIRSFSVTLAKAGVPTTISTLDGKAVLKISANSLVQDVYLTADRQKHDGEVVYKFGPQRAFSKPLRLELSYRANQFPDDSKIFVFRKVGEQWVAIPSQVFPAQHKVTAQVSSLGEFKAAFDSDFDGTNLVPETFSLEQNYPNPFNPTTTIEYAIPAAGAVELIVFNAIGQVINRFSRGYQAAGRYKIRWDATNNRGDRVSSGVYFYRIKSGDFVKTKKMILLQ